MIQVAVAQFCAQDNVTANLATCLELITSAAQEGADLVVLPEASICPPPGVFDPTPVAQPEDGPFVHALADAARAHSLHVVFGTFTPSPDGRIFNTVLALDPRGIIVARYDKLHLYDAFNIRESDVVTAGPSHDTSAIATFEIDGLTFGIATCYDLRFPEQFRALIDVGAEAIVLPAAWIVGPDKYVHWSTLARARAIESSVYLVAADQTPPTAIGHSIIIDPNGTILAEAGEERAVLVAGISRKIVGDVRARNPSINNRRFAVELRPPGTLEGAR